MGADTGARPIAHLIAPAQIGGAESVVLALAAARADRTRVIIINQTAAADSAPHPLTDQLRARGVAVDEVRCGRRRYFDEARAVARLLETSRTALLHTHGYHGTLVGWMAARRARIPIVATVHGYLDRDFKERLYGRLDRWVMRRFDAVIAVSRGVEDVLQRGGHARERLVVVKNGMPPLAQPHARARARELLGVSSEGPIVGWIGRLSVEKGADLFVQAMAAMEPAVTAIIVGDGPERPRLERMAVELAQGSARQHIVFAGAQADAARLLSAFDVLALSSRTEGMPMVILEAVNAGVPVVAFRIGGIPDLLAEDSAWLVPPLDPDALRHALREALASPDEARRRAAHAKEVLTLELSTEKWVERVWAVYSQVQSRSGNTPTR